MARFVVDRATCKCDQGTAPAALIGPGKCRSVSIGGAPSTVATTSNVFFRGVFGTCNIKTAQMGACTPCTPVPVGFWLPGASGLFVEDGIALVDSDKLRCSIGGTITVEDAGQGSVDYARDPGPEAKPWTAEDRIRSAQARELWGGEKGAVAKELEELDRNFEVQIRELKNLITKAAGGAAGIARRRGEIRDLERQQREVRAAHSVALVRIQSRQRRR